MVQNDDASNTLVQPKTKKHRDVLPIIKKKQRDVPKKHRDVLSSTIDWCFLLPDFNINSLKVVRLIVKLAVTPGAEALGLKL